MKKWKVLTLCVACMAAFALSIPSDADAKRIGGGRSFGSSPSMSRPAPSAPGGAIRQESNTFRRQTSPSAGAGAATMARPGWGGMLGGLLAGTFIGSMLSGTGTGMGGAGAGGGLLDLILIGLLVYFGIKLFRRFKANQQNGTESAYHRTDSQSGAFSGGSAWDSLKDAVSGSGQTYDMRQASAIPADFNQEEFLLGAKMAYNRLQESWDRRDLDDIAQFATPPVLRELRAQYEEDPNPGVTQVLKVDASVVEVREEGDEQRVSVFFDVLMREDPEQANPEQVRELWHFVRSRHGDNSWRLDGIQQMA